MVDNNTAPDDTDQIAELERRQREKKLKRQQRLSQTGGFLKSQFSGMDGSIFWGIKQIVAFLKLAAESVNYQLGRLTSTLNNNNNDDDTNSPHR